MESAVLPTRPIVTSRSPGSNSSNGGGVSVPIMIGVPPIDDAALVAFLVRTLDAAVAAARDSSF